MIIDNLKEVWSMELLDFILYHILSINLHPKTGISTLKEIEGIKPKVALYDKIYPPLQDKYNIPSLETTAIDICVMAKVINRLTPYNEKIIDNIYLSLEYQLYYCMENISSDNLHIPTLSALIEGCISSFDVISQTSKKIGAITSDDLNMWIYSLKAHLVKSIDRTTNSIYDLTSAARALHLINIHTARYEECDETIALLLLEILDRRNKLGLLENSPLDRRIASVSHHLFTIETILMSNLHIDLDNIYEKTFDLLNRIYKLSYNPNSGFFTFQRGSNIRYTAKDLGFIIRGLNTISKWTEDEEKQSKLHFIEQNSYMKIIFDFIKQYNRFMSNTISLCTYNNGSIPEKQDLILFPSRLLINPTYPTLDWQLYRQKNLNHILSLCNCLLDVYERPQTDISPSHIDTFIDMLLGILN